MSWLLIVVVAHFLNAGISIIDKYLLKGVFVRPVNYAFWIGMLSAVVLFLAPFGFWLPPTEQLILSLVAGIIWIAAVMIFYDVLRKEETSRVASAVGSFIPIFILILSVLFLGERFKLTELISFCLLVSGGIIISLSVLDGKLPFYKKIKFIKNFIPVIISAFLFAVYSIITKLVFLDQGFFNGLIWIRLGSVLGALLLLIPRPFRKTIFKKVEIVKKETLGFFTLARGLGIAAGLLIYWAIFLGSVTLVNALQGVQYAFLLLLAFLLFRKIPSLKEHFDKRTLFQKIFAIILIGVGLVILVIG